jgi:flagellar motor switch protein FliG
MPVEKAEAVLDEYHQMSIAHGYVTKGGMEYAKNMLFNAFGPELAKRLMDRLTTAMAKDTPSFDALQKADPQQLAKFIHNEHPQTIALILSHLNPTQAAALLVSLPTALRSDVAIRMAHMDQISPEIINKIAAVIGQKLKAVGEFSRESYGGVRAVAEMFNRLDSGTGKDILTTIDQEDNKLCEAIRQLMFVFEDLLLIDVTGLKELVGKIDRKVLTIALKGTSEQLRQRIMGLMSQRSAQILREDIESLGPVKIREVEAAQQQIIALLRDMERDGTIVLKGGVGEQYVV